ncbi:MAG TPA: hypothetical protein VG245_06660 [Candidatus Dormibacteraeota bacterium]|nr:hypothetical protein [Candidatus Dormibacteraeota bacterium]
MRLARPALVLLLGAGLAGCLGQTTSARPPGKPFPTPTPEAVFVKDPCGLLTRPEVEQAVGSAMAEAQRSSHPGNGHNCLWAPAAPGGWIVGLDATTPSTMAAQGLKGTPASLFDAQRTAQSQAIAGLGDRAAWEPSASRLMILRGQLLLQLVFLQRGARFDAAKAEALGRIALSRA